MENLKQNNILLTLEKQLLSVSQLKWFQTNSIHHLRNNNIPTILKSCPSTPSRIYINQYIFIIKPPTHPISDFSHWGELKVTYLIFWLKCHFPICHCFLGENHYSNQEIVWILCYSQTIVFWSLDHSKQYTNNRAIEETNTITVCWWYHPSYGQKGTYSSTTAVTIVQVCVFSWNWVL